MNSLIRTIRRNTPVGLATAAQSTAHSAAHATAATLADATRASARDLASATRAVAFWLAVALPAVHVPLLLTAGLTDGTARPLTALWTLNAVVLLVGSSHAPGPD